MTSGQFALAVGASAKWIQNTRRLLEREARTDAPEARWLSLVHELSTTLGVSLGTAARCADIALATVDQRHVTIDAGHERRAAIVIDLWRDSTLHLARLSRALEMPQPERRGRPATRRRGHVDPVTRAVAYGTDITLLQAGLRMSVGERLQRLDDNAAFIKAARRSLQAHA